MKLIAAFLCIVLLTSAAWAQQPSPEREYTVKLNQSQLATIETVFAKTRGLPVSWEEINSVLQTVVKQAQDQDKAASDEAKAEKPKAPEGKP